MQDNTKILDNPDVKIEEIGNNSDGEIVFDINQLHESNLKKMVNYFDSFTSSPIEFLLTGTLASLSGAIGKNAFISITENWKLYFNIYSVLIGVSGVLKKSTALNVASDELQRIEARNYNQFCRELSDYNKLSSEEKKEKPKPERNYTLFPQDSTVESLSDILANAQRGLLIHSEFGSFLAQLNRGYAGDSKQFITSIYDTPLTYEVSRATKENTLMERPFISITAASTIDWIRENSSDIDLRSGFFARFLFSIRNKPSKKYIPLLSIADLTKQTEKYFNCRNVFERLVNLTSPIEVGITKEASQLHKSFDIDSYKNLIKAENTYEPSFKDRLIAYTLKFAAIIAVSDERDCITLEDMQDAILISNYYKKNIERLLNYELGKSEFEKGELAVRDKINQNKGEISRRELLQKVHMKASELDEIVFNLKEKEVLREYKKKSDYKNISGKIYSLIEND